MKITALLIAAGLVAPSFVAAQNANTNPKISPDTRKAVHQDKRKSEKLRRDLAELDRKQDEALKPLNADKQAKVSQLNRELAPRRDQISRPFEQQKKPLQDQLARISADEDRALQGLDADQRAKHDQINKDYDARRAPLIKPFEQQRQELRRQLDAAEAAERH